MGNFTRKFVGQNNIRVKLQIIGNISKKYISKYKINEK